MCMCLCMYMCMCTCMLVCTRYVPQFHEYIKVILPNIFRYLLVRMCIAVLSYKWISSVSLFCSVNTVQYGKYAKTPSTAPSLHSPVGTVC
jgi:hypothetical protein